MLYCSFYGVLCGYFLVGVNSTFFEKFIWILGLISIGLTEGSVNSSFFEKFGVVGICSSFTNRPISAPGEGVPGAILCTIDI
jgi:hypothetical protein